MINLTAGVISMACWVCPLFAQSDRVHQAELQKRLLVSRVTQNARDEQLQRFAGRQEFEGKFNQLVQAVASFAKEYNRNQGAVWPRAEAEKLRKALRELESAEKSLR